MEQINEFFKLIFDQQPVMVVLVIIIMFLFLVIYATRSVSTQQTQDHEEKRMLIDLFSDLKGVIDRLSVAQEKRNEAFGSQIEEQRATNKNLSALNVAFADYHSSLADTISTMFRTQITARLDKVELKVDELIDVAKNKPDCNDEIINRMNNLHRDIEIMKDYIVKKETERLEDL